MEYRQVITIDDNVGDIMRLPCIFSCHKKNSEGELEYLLYDWDEKGQYVTAHKGDKLCEDYEGKWYVERK